MSSAMDMGPEFAPRLGISIAAFAISFIFSVFTGLKCRCTLWLQLLLIFTLLPITYALLDNLVPRPELTKLFSGILAYLFGFISSMLGLKDLCTLHLGEINVFRRFRQDDFVLEMECFGRLHGHRSSLTILSGIFASAFSPVRYFLYNSLYYITTWPVVKLWSLVLSAFDLVWSFGIGVWSYSSSFVGSAADLCTSIYRILSGGFGAISPAISKAVDSPASVIGAAVDSCFELVDNCVEYATEAVSSLTNPMESLKSTHKNDAVAAIRDHAWESFVHKVLRGTLFTPEQYLVGGVLALKDVISMPFDALSESFRGSDRVDSRPELSSSTSPDSGAPISDETKAESGGFSVSIPLIHFIHPYYLNTDLTPSYFVVIIVLVCLLFCSAILSPLFQFQDSNGGRLSNQLAHLYSSFEQSLRLYSQGIMAYVVTVADSILAALPQYIGVARSYCAAVLPYIHLFFTAMQNLAVIIKSISIQWGPIILSSSVVVLRLVVSLLYKLCTLLAKLFGFTLHTANDDSTNASQAGLNNSLTGPRDPNQNINPEIQRLTAALTTEQEERARIQEEHDRIERDIQAAQQAVRTERELRQAAETSLGIAERSRQTALSEQEDAEKKKDEEEKQKSAVAKKNIEDLQEQIRELNDRLDKGDSKTEDLEASKDAEKQRLTDSLAECQKEKSLLAGEVAVLQKAIDNLEPKDKQATGEDVTEGDPGTDLELARLKDENEQAKDELRKCHEHGVKLQAKVTGLEEKIKEMDKDKRSGVNRAYQFKQDLDATRARENALKDDNRKLQARVDHLEGLPDSEVAEAKLATALSDLVTAHSREANLKDEVARLEKLVAERSNDKSSDSDTRITHLQQEIQDNANKYRDNLEKQSVRESELNSELMSTHDELQESLAREKFVSGKLLRLKRDLKGSQHDQDAFANDLSRAQVIIKTIDNVRKESSIHFGLPEQTTWEILLGQLDERIKTNDSELRTAREERESHRLRAEQTQTRLDQIQSVIQEAAIRMAFDANQDLDTFLANVVPSDSVVQVQQQLKAVQEQLQTANNAHTTVLNDHQTLMQNLGLDPANPDLITLQKKISGGEKLAEVITALQLDPDDPNIEAYVASLVHPADHGKLQSDYAVLQAEFTKVESVFKKVLENWGVLYDRDSTAEGIIDEITHTEAAKLAADPRFRATDFSTILVGALNIGLSADAADHEIIETLRHQRDEVQQLRQTFATVQAQYAYWHFQLTQRNPTDNSAHAIRQYWDDFVRAYQKLHTTNLANITEVNRLHNELEDVKQRLEECENHRRQAGVMIVDPSSNQVQGSAGMDVDPSSTQGEGTDMSGMTSSRQPQGSGGINMNPPSTQDEVMDSSSNTTQTQRGSISQILPGSGAWARMEQGNSATSSGSATPAFGSGNSTPFPFNINITPLEPSRAPTPTHSERVVRLDLLSRDELLQTIRQREQRVREEGLGRELASWDDRQAPRFDSERRRGRQNPAQIDVQERTEMIAHCRKVAKCLKGGTRPA